MASSLARRSNIFGPFDVRFKAKQLTAQWRRLPKPVDRSMFSRKLLEVLFDGRAESEGRVTANAKAFYDELAGERKLLTIPADATAASGLAKEYRNTAVGSIHVKRSSDRVYFDFDEFSSEMGSRVNPDGTTSFYTLAPGLTGFEFVVGAKQGKRTLTLRDSQHEYVYVEK